MNTKAKKFITAVNDLIKITGSGSKPNFMTVRDIDVYVDDSNHHLQKAADKVIKWYNTGEELSYKLMSVLNDEVKYLEQL